MQILQIILSNTLEIQIAFQNHSQWTMTGETFYLQDHTGTTILASAVVNSSGIAVIDDSSAPFLTLGVQYQCALKRTDNNYYIWGETQMQAYYVGYVDTMHVMDNIVNVHAFDDATQEELPGMSVYADVVSPGDTNVTINYTLITNATGVASLYFTDKTGAVSVPITVYDPNDIYCN